MRKYSEKMFKNMMKGIEECRVGNHKMSKIGESWYFRYHGNIIMVIDVECGRIMVDNCGYYTSSTTCAINSHLEAVYEFLDWNMYDFVDCTKDLKFKDKIKTLFDKNIVSNEYKF